MSPVFRKRTLQRFFEEYVKDTPKGAFIKNKEIFVGKLPNIGIFDSRNLYITARTLKHIYDKRTEYCTEVFLPNLFSVVSKPNKIYLNAPNKRGLYLLAKSCERRNVIVIIEAVLKGKKTTYYIISSFLIRNSQLEKYRELWPGGTATPSS